MRISRRITGTAAAVTAVVGLGLAAAGPASAVGTAAWRAYGNTNPITSSSSTWLCYKSKPVDTGVEAQVCTVRTPGGAAAQGAVIVRNNRSSLYSANAYLDMRTEGGIPSGSWACPSSGVAAGSWSVCFGPTREAPAKMNTYGEVNGVTLYKSPNL